LCFMWVLGVVEVSASCRSLVQRSPTDCGVSECDREPSTVRTPWLTGGAVAPWGEKRNRILFKGLRPTD
jgi:hypothetical protein